MYRASEVVSYVHPTEQWVKELKAWFETAIIKCQYTVLAMVQRNKPPEDDMIPSDPWNLCDKVFFWMGAIHYRYHRYEALAQSISSGRIVTFHSVSFGMDTELRGRARFELSASLTGSGSNLEALSKEDAIFDAVWKFATGEGASRDIQTTCFSGDQHQQMT